MSDLVLQRVKFDANATQGILTLNGERLCVTLENRPPREVGVKEPGLSRIPAGTHGLRLRDEGGFYNRYTNKWAWHRDMIEIVLPGWKYVLFHVGNYHTDTHGCVLVGKTPGQSEQFGLCVWSSVKAYKRIYPVLHAIAARGGVLVVRDEG